jgi:hypothetical protein
MPGLIFLPCSRTWRKECWYTRALPVRPSITSHSPRITPPKDEQFAPTDESATFERRRASLDLLDGIVIWTEFSTSALTDSDSTTLAGSLQIELWA